MHIPCLIILSYRYRIGFILTEIIGLKCASKYICVYKCVNQHTETTASNIVLSFKGEYHEKMAYTIDSASFTLV